MDNAVPALSIGTDTTHLINSANLQLSSLLFILMDGT